MEQPSRVLVQGFERELQRIHPDLRVVWGAQEYGVDRWVIQRQIPADVHAQCLEEFESLFPGEDRYFDQSLTDDNGDVRGTRRFDRVPSWALVHIVEDREHDIDSPLGYRLPDNRDIQTIWHWLHDYRNIEEQLRVMRDERAKFQEKNRQERVECLARDIRDSRSVWEDPSPVYIDTRNLKEE